MTPKALSPGRRWRRRLLPLLLLPLLLGGTALALLLETTPLVAPLPPPSVSDALQTRELAIRLLQGLEGNQERVEIQVSAEELSSLLTVAARGFPQLSGRVELFAGKALVSASWRVSFSPFPLYLNLQQEILPANNGLLLGPGRLGKLTNSGPLALRLLGLVLDLGFGRGEGMAVLGSLQTLELTEQQATMQLNQLSQLKSRLKRLPARIARLRDLTLLLSSPWPEATLQLYLERLQQVSATLPPQSTPDLGVYLRPLFELAGQRSQLGNPVQENQAALLALAAHLEDSRFHRLLGTAESDQSLSPPPQVLLAQRDDLRRHFVVSAGLQLLTEQGVTAAIGEWKELLDAGKGRSGFSFADLAADRAGAALARSASNPAAARKLQQLLAASHNESDYFPAIADLPENLSRGEFESRFGNVDSPAYRQLLQQIDQRLSRLPVHRR